MIMPPKKGYKQTQEHVAARFESRKGFRHTEETKKKISELKKKQGLRTRGTLGWHPSEETRRKMSEANKGRILTTEQRIARRGSGNPNWKGGNSKRKVNGGIHSRAEWESLKKEYGFTCPVCGKSEPKIKLWKDHIIPVSCGGLNSIENIQPLCGACNRKKFTKTFYAEPKMENKKSDQKKILFIASYQAHLARQKLLLEELEKRFDVVTRFFEPDGETMTDKAVQMLQISYLLIQKVKPDALLVRGDRFEVLPQASAALYAGVPIIHCEGGDLSGVIDNKIRHSVTQLSDFHFCTNSESHQRIIGAGIKPESVWNFGSLDVEYAASVQEKKLKDKPYILVAYHPISDEDENEVTEAIKGLHGYEIINIVSNKDYGRQYGTEHYDPEDYINLLRGAACCVGNSSSFLKEASIFGVGVVNVGSRQNKRLKPRNVLDVPCNSDRIKKAVAYQLGNRYAPDDVYYQPGTARRIAETLTHLL